MAKLINRIIWQLNRSPLRKITKLILILFSAKVIWRRIQLARALTKNPDIDHLVHQLKADGYCCLTGHCDNDLLQGMFSCATDRLANAESASRHQSQTSKPFWVRLLDEEMEDGKMRISTPWVRFAIQPMVLEIVSRVLGQIPRLDYVLLTLSQYSRTSYQKSQLWHLDYDDVHVIKLFVYLSDVNDLNDGPFTFIPASKTRKLGFSLRSHRKDEAVFCSEHTALSDIKYMIAPALSVFMVDTSRCLHMGSRLSEGHQRLLYTATFTTAPSMFPGYKRKRFVYDAKFANEVEKYVLVG